MTTPPIEIVYSFDSTGSMYPCLTQVRQNLKGTIARLFRDIPGLRVGIVAHGDYCDRNSTYVTKELDLTTDPDLLCRFVDSAGPTGGGDAPECYELAMRKARQMSWAPGSKRAFVLIGDDIPHGPRDNPERIDWRQELESLSAIKVPVYGVQCLGRSHARPFYEELARHSGGFHISLDQFSHVTDMMLAICYNQQGPGQVEHFEQEVIKQGRMSRGLDTIFGQLLRRSKATGRFIKADLKSCAPWRFQVMNIGRDTAIKDFVTENGLTFKIGRGFYEFTKTETIQGGKEIVLMERSSGDLFEGKAARDMIGLSAGVTVRVKPSDMERFAVFVQSTSANRKLVGGTRFLYEVDVSR